MEEEIRSAYSLVGLLFGNIRSACWIRHTSLFGFAGDPKRNVDSDPMTWNIEIFDIDRGVAVEKYCCGYAASRGMMIKLDEDSPDENMLYGVSLRGFVESFDRRVSSESAQTFSLQVNSAQGYSLHSCVHSRHEVVVGDGESQVFVLDVRYPDSFARQFKIHSGGYVWDIARVSGSGRRYVSGEDDHREVCLWDSGNGKILAKTQTRGTNIGVCYWRSDRCGTESFHLFLDQDDRIEFLLSIGFLVKNTVHLVPSVKRIVLFMALVGSDFG